jgi:hypothetical protein
MTISRRQFVGAGICIGAGLAVPGAAIVPSSPAVPLPPPPLKSSADIPNPVSRALEALVKHGNRIANRDRVAVADFSLHSAEARFHLVNVDEGSIETSYLVSHGRGSDPANLGYLVNFSNRPGSNASSSGSFLTADTYYGAHGRSRRLEGLDPENDRAWERAIVIHGADYVDRSMAELQGRVGRSLGCFAFEQDKIGEVLERLGPGRLLFSTK